MSATQLSIPLSGDSDERPAAEIVADAFGFKLAYHDTDKGRFYAVQDWIIGVAQTSTPGPFWRMMQRRVFKSTGIQLRTLCSQLPYKASNNKTYKMDFADAETLYTITQRMDVNTGIRDEVLKYLAKAGVVVDELRADPDAVYAKAKQDKEYRRLIEEGFTPEEARQWLEVRLAGKQTRSRITAEWAIRGITGRRQFAQLTNEVTEVALGKTATELKQERQIKGSLRDYEAAAALMALKITEDTSIGLHQFRDSEGMGELSEDVQDVRPIMDAARPEIEKAFSKKVRRIRRSESPELEG